MKAVISTFIVTLFSIAIAVKFFFHSLLALTGYTAIPMNEFAKLTANKAAIEKLKKNHVQKKDKTTKRFIKRTGKKVGATAASAATIGTVAVVGTLTYIELNEYCEEKKQLSIEENILYDKQEIFNVNACIESAKNDSGAIAKEAWLMVQQTGQEATQTLQEAFEPASTEMAKIYEKIQQYFK